MYFLKTIENDKVIGMSNSYGIIKNHTKHITLHSEMNVKGCVLLSQKNVPLIAFYSL